MCAAVMLRMAAARSHKDLICWQRAYELKLQVYELLRTGTVTHDFDVTNQLKESASFAFRFNGSRSDRRKPHLGSLRILQPRTCLKSRRGEEAVVEPKQNPKQPIEPNEQDLLNPLNPMNPLNQ